MGWSDRSQRSRARNGGAQCASGCYAGHDTLSNVSTVVDVKMQLVIKHHRIDILHRHFASGSGFNDTGCHLRKVRFRAVYSLYSPIHADPTAAKMSSLFGSSSSSSAGAPSISALERLKGSGLIRRHDCQEGADEAGDCPRGQCCTSSWLAQL